MQSWETANRFHNLCRQIHVTVPVPYAIFYGGNPAAIGFFRLLFRMWSDGYI